MQPLKQIYLGAMGASAAALCCVTPILAGTLALLGFGAAIAWLDFVLLPLAVVFIAMALLGWLRLRRGGARSRSTIPADPAAERLSLIYFRGCPNVDQVRTALQDAAVSFHEVCQDDLPADHPHRAYTSPTILQGDRLVYGAASGAGGCSLQPLDAAALRASLQSAGAPPLAGSGGR